MIFEYLKQIPNYISSDSKVIIMLHGIGSNMDDLFGLKDEFSENDYVFSLNGINKYFSGKSRYDAEFYNNKTEYDYDDVKSAGNYIFEFIKYLKTEYGIENNEIYLFGFSQGAIISYFLLLNYPEIFSGIIATSGRLLDEYSKIKTDLKDKKIFIGHGIYDDVIGIDKSRNSYDFFKEKTTNLISKEYPIPHSISIHEINDILKFLG